MLVKAWKAKNFPYESKSAAWDKNLILMNSEILVMRSQNEAKLKVCSLFSNLSSELTIATVDPASDTQSLPFIVKDM